MITSVMIRVSRQLVQHVCPQGLNPLANASEGIRPREFRGAFARTKSHNARARSGSRAAYLSLIRPQKPTLFKLGLWSQSEYSSRQLGA
jgi:hypothetical protein